MASAEQVRAEVEGYLAKWVPLLGLTNWQIVLTVEKMDWGQAAQTSWEGNYRKALLTVNLTPKDSWEPERQLHGELLEKTILHELSHLLLATLSDCVIAEFQKESVFRRQFEGREETVVDELVSIFWRLHGAG